MAIVAEVSKIRFAMKLNNGLDPQGNIKTISVSFPALDKDNVTNQGLYNIMDAVAPLLDKSVYSNEKTTIETLEME